MKMITSFDDLIRLNVRFWAKLFDMISCQSEYIFRDGGVYRPCIDSFGMNGLVVIKNSFSSDMIHCTTFPSHVCALLSGPAQIPPQ